MVRALFMGGWSDFHSKKVTRAAHQAQAATENVAVEVQDA
jgi:hypothetical protein